MAEKLRHFYQHFPLYYTLLKGRDVPNESITAYCQLLKREDLVATCTLRSLAVLKGKPVNFTYQSCFTCHGECCSICEKFEPFYGSRGSCAKSDKLPGVMSLELLMVGLKISSLKKKKSMWCQKELRSRKNQIAMFSSQQHEATLATHTTHHDCRLKCHVKLHCG